MGYIEDIEAMELDDDVKERLIASHKAEVDPLQKSTVEAQREAKRTSVEAEITELSDMGFDAVPGALKYYRRVLLSDDEQPGAVLLSDAELNLSGDEATGSRESEDISVAGALKHFVGLIKTAADKDGKLATLFSDQGINAENVDPPKTGDADEETNEHKENLGKITGQPIKRSETRYRVGGGV